MTLLHKVTNSNKDYCSLSRDPSAAGKSIARLLACDAFWTRVRAVAAGYDMSSLCDLCGAANDTIAHRWQPGKPVPAQAASASARRKQLNLI